MVRASGVRVSADGGGDGGFGGWAQILHKLYDQKIKDRLSMMHRQHPPSEMMVPMNPKQKRTGASSEVELKKL